MSQNHKNSNSSPLKTGAGRQQRPAAQDIPASRVKPDPTPARKLGAVSGAAGAAPRLTRWVPTVGQVVEVVKCKRRAKVLSVSGGSVTVDMGPMMGPVKVPFSGVRR